MDRNIVYPGAIPLDTDNLSPQVNAMVALGLLAAATMGTGTTVDGLAISQTTVASMTVNVGPGVIFQLETVDSSAFGSLSSNSAPLVKFGLNLTQTQFLLTAPGTSGQSINYLIEASFSETDTTPVVLPYYNSANPASPYSGPANSGTPQNTQRLQRVALQLKAGTPAATGTQTTPATDAGWTALYVVTVNNGQTTITNANLANAQVPTAPFISFKLPALRPGFASGQQVYNPAGGGTSTFVVPNGVYLLDVQLWGAGSGSQNASGGTAGAGGGGGSYCRKRISVTPGQSISVVTGAGGSRQGGGGSINGGNSTFLTMTAGGSPGPSGAFGGTGGFATGGDVNFAGEAGGGNGGASGGSGGSAPVSGFSALTSNGNVGVAGALFGGGASGGAGTSGNGAGGADGACVIQW